MIRRGFVMEVFADTHEEYERRHNPIWQELEDTLRSHGVTNYSIFLNAATNQLFGYAELEDLEQWQAIAGTDVCQKWWKHMGEVMPSNADNSPVSTEMKEVFHMD